MEIFRQIQLDNWWLTNLGFIYQLIYDLGTYFLLSLIFIYLYKTKIIGINVLYLSLLFLLTPFLFNNSFFSWVMLPDQMKYLNNAYLLRDNPEMVLDIAGKTPGHKKVWIASAIYAFSPIISFETFKGISLFNRAIFLLTLIFFSKKKYIDNYNVILFLILPSVTLYTSVALRENLIILSLLYFVYFYYEKNYSLNLLVILFLFITKPQMLAVIGIFLILNTVIKPDKINYKVFSILFVTFCISLYIIEIDTLVNSVNQMREGFFREEFGSYKSVSATTDYSSQMINLSFSSIPVIIRSFLNFIAPPLIKGDVGILSIIHLFEFSFLIFYAFFRMNLQEKVNKYILFKWFLVLMISYLLHSLIVFNNFTILRYKLPIMMFVIFGYFVNVKFNQLKNENSSRYNQFK
jgi:hypothetical protein